MKMDPIDARAEKLTEIIQWNTLYSKTVVSEADARFKLIDRILKEVLGWHEESVQTEEDTENGRLDYKLVMNSVTRSVIEAKRTSVDFGITSHRSGQAFKLEGSVFSINAKLAIKQVVGYCAFKSAELACCTNGNEWIIFRANRLGDGREVMAGKAFVFGSLTDIAANFRVFHDLLSRNSIEDLRFRALFQEAEGLHIRDFSFCRMVRPQSTRKLLSREQFAIDFDAIMASFFHRLKGESDTEMIAQCFVVTTESDLAEHRISRIADDLVHRIRDLDCDTGYQLTRLIKEVQNLHKNRFVLLVGNKGSGKSTFVDRFFSTVLTPDILEGLVVVRVDLSLCDGDAARVQSWLNQAFLKSCEEAVYGDEGPNWNETIGAMFWPEYKRWKTVTKKTLFNTNKEKFDIEFGNYVESCRQSEPHDYIKRLIANIVRSRKKVPCLIFDNTDHHSIKFQEAVFQYARSIYEAELSMVLMPITDRTSWQLSKEGVLQSFESEIFHLPVPDAFRVVERRIHYLAGKVSEAKTKENAQYFIGRNIRLNISDIEKFAHTLNRIFVESRATSEWMGSLVNFDVRRLLELVKDVVGSPHISIDKLFSAHIANDADVIQSWKVKQAIIKRKYDIYPSGEHPFVQNIFDLGIDRPTSPLLPLRVLQFLRDVPTDNSGDFAAFVPLTDVFEYFTAMGFDISDVILVIEKLLVRGLVLNYDPTISDVDKVSKLEIAPAGGIHLLWGTTDEDYIKIMAQVTSLRDEGFFKKIEGFSRNFSLNWANCIVAFIEYTIHEDSTWCQVPDHRNYIGQSKLSRRLLRVADDARRNSENSRKFTRFSSKYTEPRY